MARPKLESVLAAMGNAGAKTVEALKHIIAEKRKTMGASSTENLSARARILALLDEGTFSEIGTYAFRKNNEYDTEEGLESVICGWGSLSVLGQKIRELGKSRPLVVCDKGIVEAGITEKVGTVLREAGLEFTVFDGVHPDPSAEIVDEAVETGLAFGCDCVIGVGGGSKQNLYLAERGLHRQTETEQAVARGVAASGEDLVQVDLARSGAPRKRRLCQPALRDHPIQKRRDGIVNERILMRVQIVAQRAAVGKLGQPIETLVQ